MKRKTQAMNPLQKGQPMRRIPKKIYYLINKIKDTGETVYPFSLPRKGKQEWLHLYDLKKKTLPPYTSVFSTFLLHQMSHVSTRKTSPPNMMP